MKRFVAILCVCVGMAGVSAGDAPSGEAWERYEALVERNPFSRDRGRRPDPRPAERRPETRPAPPESYIVLKGVSQADAEYVAFLENLRGGMSKRNVGQEIAGGKIAEITLDGIVFEKDGEAREVAIGERLGATAPTALDTSAETRAPSPSATAPSERGEDGMSVLERLRQQRARDLGR